MKIQALYDLQQEVNRLYIAGSKFAKNDPRLTKQVPVLNKLGERAPVFNKLAQSIEELTQSESAESAEKLLNIGTLLYSILYTQGETTEDGVERAVLSPVLQLGELNTSASFLELKPVIEALSTTNQGRMAVVEEGFKQGIFNDFRTYEYLDRGLGDKYSELADYIEKTIIPKVGVKMLPFIKNNFSYEGRTEDIRRFRLLHQMKDKDIEGMISTILEGSAVNLQAEAVKMLADDVKNEDLIIKLADDKHKPVREAAYLALAKLNTKVCLDKLTQVFVKNKNSTNLEGIVNALNATNMPFFLEEVFNKIQADFESLLSMGNEADDKKILAELSKLYSEMPALEGKKDDYIVQFQESILINEQYCSLVNKKKSILGDTSKWLAGSIISNLYRLNTERSRKALKTLFENASTQKYWGEYITNNYFHVVANEYGKEKIYDLFKDNYAKGQLMNSAFIRNYAQGTYNGYATWKDLTLDTGKIDKRWFELFLSRSEKNWTANDNVEAIYLILTCCGLKNDVSHKALTGYMQGVIKSKNLPYYALFLFISDKMMQSDMSQRFELLTSALENNRYMSYDSEINKHIANADYLKEFPKEFAKRFRALYDKSKIETYQEIAQKIEENPGKFQQLINKITK